MINLQEGFVCSMVEHIGPVRFKNGGGTFDDVHFPPTETRLCAERFTDDDPRLGHVTAEYKFNSWLATCDEAYVIVRVNYGNVGVQNLRVISVLYRVTVQT